MNKKKSETFKIEINKKKLMTIAIVVLVIVLLGLICFLVSSNNSEKYTNNPNNVTLEDNGNNSDESTLTDATRDAGEISDDERENMSEITVNDYLELYKSDNYSVVLLSKETCSYCQIAVPILENIVYEYDADIKYIDTAKASEDDIYNLVKSDDVFDEGYGTPFLMIVGKNEIKDSFDGLGSKEAYIEFLKEYGFIGDENE